MSLKITKSNYIVDINLLKYVIDALPNEKKDIILKELKSIYKENIKNMIYYYSEQIDDFSALDYVMNISLNNLYNKANIPLKYYILDLLMYIEGISVKYNDETDTIFIYHFNKTLA